MGFFSMFDPTAPSSPFGGLVRQGLGAIPGGSTALGVVDAANAARRGTTDRTGTTDRSGGTPGAGPAGVAAPVPWYRKPAVLIGAAGAVVLLLLGLLVFRRK